MLLLFILGKNGNWGRTIRNVMGGGEGIGIFEPLEFFFVTKFLVWIYVWP